MDAIFINPLPSGTGINRATMEMPLGIAYLAAMLEKNGFSASIIDAYCLGLDALHIVRIIPQDVLLIGIYANSFTYNAVSELCRLCRFQFPAAAVVVGGPLASADPELVVKEIPCHGVICGEGEFSIVKMLTRLKSGLPAFGEDVGGAVYQNDQDGTIRKNPVRRIDNLDEIPFPAYHLMPDLKQYKSRARKTPVGAIITSRGCAHECVFCSKDIFARTVTFRSPQNVLAEIDFLVSEYGIRQLDILDDNFAMKRSHMEPILDGIIARDYDLAVNLQLGIRSENVDEALLKKMKAAGIFKLAFGVESADPDVLAACRKKLDLASIEKATALAKSLGFVVYGFFIIGLPNETEESFLRTIEFAKRCDFDIANFTMALPFVGAELYRMVERNGHFLVDTKRNIDHGFYGGRPFFTYGTATENDYYSRYKRAYSLFYTWEKKLRMILGIRSARELAWYANAALDVGKGFLKQTVKTRRP